ncbi:hypothetical protein NGUA11_04265 [Salmonella enterica]|nr:hypothetical protein NGUA11_04265 [Salmonella enterica]
MLRYGVNALAQQPATDSIGSVLADQPQSFLRQPAVRATVRVVESELICQQVAQGGDDLLRQRGLRTMDSFSWIAAKIKRHRRPVSLLHQFTCQPGILILSVQAVQQGG